MEERAPLIVFNAIRKPDGIAHGEDESRRSSLATAVEEIPETPCKELRPERKDRFEGVRTCLCKVRTPILVVVLSILVVWATNVVGITYLSNIIYRACQMPGVPTIASQFPMGLCSLAPPSDQTFAKVLDAQVKYEKIFKYIEKRATLPDRMTETAKRVDTKVDQSSFDEERSETPTIYSLESKFFHSAEFSHAVLDLGSFLKQAKETAQRLVVANQVAKASLQALISKKTRWKFLNTDPFRTWEVSKIHDGLTETSMEQIILVIDRAEVARKKIEDLEDGIQTTETSTVYGHFPARDFSVHLQEAHALLEIVRDGTEKIKNDISKAQKHCRFFKKASHTDKQKMELESMITIWTNQLDHNIRLLGEALKGPRFVEATASSKTFGTIDPLFTTTPSLTPSLSPTSFDT
ncbi:hypothetical protein PFICI_12126 [Pestalotiopsis fici W106-1]|uniref:Uncharacterized protein n=1 Tax=Pestalotiopsis fici (strain W106-1 / CGMCC3.15140) TaxID=1229662 RepID=W3WSG6_PESFW|nr:uncharacterized protein PFICI_12126 [Pestalotiopsis fici W106-1]ETS76739.1 hypothetical protein PFICI_12126 [Pestalotiopsis fici W106-1]